MSKKLKEDNLDLDVSFQGQSIQELYDSLGDSLFDAENIPYLKSAGLLSENGYPIEEYEGWGGDTKTREMSIRDIYDLDTKFADSPYIQELAIQEILRKGKHGDSNEVLLNFKDHDIKLDSRDMSNDFVCACFSGDVWDYFSGVYDDIRFRDCEYHLDEIPSEVIDTLESYGFPKDIYNQLMRGEADEDSPLEKYYDDLEMAMCIAVGRAYEDGSSSACLNDFENAWKEAIPEGCRWDSQASTEDIRPIYISEEFIRAHIKDIFDMVDYNSTDMLDNTHDYVIELINNNLDFNEPYAGWQDFDEESFKDCLYNEILEINFPDQIAVELEPGERSLLDFDGETGEYREDLDLDVIEPEKAKKLFYKYSEYNKELSKKAWRLDSIRYHILLDFLKNNNGYSDMADDIEGYDDYPEDVILSKIKPSYVNDYRDENSYVVWLDNGDYDVFYVGLIPGYVGDKIIKTGNLSEDLELDIVPFPDLKINHPYRLSHEPELLKQLVMDHAGDDGWVVQWYNSLNDEYENYYYTNVYDAANFYNSYELTDEDDCVYLLYTPDMDDEKYQEGTYTVACRCYGDSLDEDKNEPELAYYRVFWEPDNNENPEEDDEDDYHTLLVVRQSHNIEPTPEEALALYTESGEIPNWPGHHIYDVNGISKEEAEEEFGDLRFYNVYDLDKLAIVDINEDVEPEKNYTYYEVYCEDKDETTWDFSEEEFLGEPSNDNQSIILKVDDNTETPTIGEVQAFIEKEKIISDNYIALYLSELNPDYAPVEDLEAYAHEYVPNTESVVIEDLEPVKANFNLPETEDEEIHLKSKEDREAFLNIFHDKLMGSSSDRLYGDKLIDPELTDWKIEYVDNTDGHHFGMVKDKFYWLLISYKPELHSGLDNPNGYVDQSIFFRI